MKKFIICTCVLVLLCFGGWYAYFYMGFYISFGSEKTVETFMQADEDTIYMLQDGEYRPFEIRGVNIGNGIPGEWGADFAIAQADYLRWFSQISELGANTIRVYTILHDDFYNALYDYNLQREAAGEAPLYLLHGVWADDYSRNSHKDMYDDGLLPEMIEDGKTIIDIIHGHRSHLGRDGDGSGNYRKDISRWVLGYILGVDWESGLVIYTNQNNPEITGYQGTYMSTTAEATPFEAALAQLGDELIEYETNRYKQQRLVSFSNWPTTDPFRYSIITSTYRLKSAAVNVEHIQPTEAFISGYFASYHVYAYYPDYLETELEAADYSDVMLEEIFGENQANTLEYRLERLGVPAIQDYLAEADYYDGQGRVNTYYAYLKALNNFHNIPVVIAEYGLTTGRGRAQVDVNTGRSQGYITEQEQGEGLVSCYTDIMAAGSAGSCLFSWQDEWFKRTWNTLHAVDMDRSPYWSDYQTNEQFFGLLTFDPGEAESICYVDGNPSEWMEEDVVLETDAGRLSMKYDEKFLYFYAEAEDYDPEADVLYIPLDITPKSGSTYCENYNVSFENAADFLIYIDGTENSRVLVQERYEVLRAIYWESYYVQNPYIYPPDSNSPEFVNINMAMLLRDVLPRQELGQAMGEVFETGLLRCGNANPAGEDFDSLADFCFTEQGVEIRLPWQLLNFSDPSQMMVHDDYYEKYGVENLQIRQLSAGLGFSGEEGSIPMAPFELKGWGNKVTYHERLKASYYILQDYWAAQ